MRPSLRFRLAIYFYDQRGNRIAAESLVDITGDLEVTEDGPSLHISSLKSLG